MSLSSEAKPVKKNVKRNPVQCLEQVLKTNTASGVRVNNFYTHIRIYINYTFNMKPRMT